MVTNTKVERKNDHFLDLLERMKAFNSELKKERKFEPHHRSLLAKTVIDNSNNRQKMTDIKNSKKDSLIETSDERNDVKTLKTTFTESKEDGHIMQQKSGMIEVEKEISPIEIMQEEDDVERQENNDKKDGIVMERKIYIEAKGKNPSAIEIIQKKNLDIIDKDKNK